MNHVVLGTPLSPPFPEGLQQALFGMGCFWGAERRFWTASGVHTTSVGYADGEVEAVRVVFDPAQTTYDELLRIFWEGHDPTQGMRQGNDVGPRYRSAIYPVDDAQRVAAEAARARYGAELAAAGYGPITTTVAAAGSFADAEDHHQQYLARDPDGYCGLGGTGVSCPVGLAA